MASIQLKAFVQGIRVSERFAAALPLEIPERVQCDQQGRNREDHEDGSDRFPDVSAEHKPPLWRTRVLFHDSDPSHDWVFRTDENPTPAI
jgi:hypothetical protein